MGQTNGTATPFEEKASSDELEIAQAEDNFEEYNMLSDDELAKLEADDSPEGQERLRELAEHYDIPFDGLRPEEIVNRIRNLQNTQDSSYMFNGTE